MLLAEKKIKKKEDIEKKMAGWDMLGPFLCWTNHDQNNHNQMLLAEKKIKKKEDIERKMTGWDMLGPLPGGSQV